MNGRGVHILKAGSKRRRTQADMAEQAERESVVQLDAASAANNAA